jgi:GntR family transcriptional repressor for pyruvate dehydrogenase complex
MLSDKFFQPTMTVHLRAVARPQCLADEVTRALVSHIAAGDWRPGDRLPTEKALGLQFGVSRAVIREAISRLKSEGYVATYQGKGAFVAEEPGLAAFRLAAGTPDQVPNEHLFELRALIEQSAAELAARRRTARDLAAIRSALADMRRAYAQDGLGLEADIRFHEAIAAATHNPVLERFMQFVGRHLREIIRLARVSVAKYENRLGEVDREHAAILHAIERRDPPAARVAAALHIAKGARRLRIRV